MPRAAFHEMQCPIARTLDVIGERWTPLVLRDVALGIARFDDIQRNLGISRKVLTQRLEALVEHGVIQRVPYQQRPPRFDYVLTEKGVDLAKVLLAMAAFGNRWEFDAGVARMHWRHEPCGAITEPVIACSSCGDELTALTISPILDEGYRAGPGTTEIPAAVRRWQERRSAPA